MSQKLYTYIPYVCVCDVCVFVCQEERVYVMSWLIMRCWGRSRQKLKQGGTSNRAVTWGGNTEKCCLLACFQAHTEPSYTMQAHCPHRLGSPTLISNQDNAHRPSWWVWFFNRGTFFPGVSSWQPWGTLRPSHHTLDNYYVSAIASDTRRGDVKADEVLAFIDISV